MFWPCGRLLDMTLLSAGNFRAGGRDKKPLKRESQRRMLIDEDSPASSTAAASLL